MLGLAAATVVTARTILLTIVSANSWVHPVLAEVTIDLPTGGPADTTGSNAAAVTATAWQEAARRSRRSIGTQRWEGAKQSANPDPKGRRTLHRERSEARQCHAPALGKRSLAV